MCPRSGSGSRREPVTHWSLFTKRERRRARGRDILPTQTPSERPHSNAVTATPSIARVGTDCRRSRDILGPVEVALRCPEPRWATVPRRVAPAIGLGRPGVVDEARREAPERRAPLRLVRRFGRVGGLGEGPPPLLHRSRLAPDTRVPRPGDSPPRCRDPPRPGLPGPLHPRLFPRPVLFLGLSLGSVTLVLPRPGTLPARTTRPPVLETLPRPAYRLVPRPGPLFLPYFLDSPPRIHFESISHSGPLHSGPHPGLQSPSRRLSRPPQTTAPQTPHPPVLVTPHTLHGSVFI